MVKRNGYNAGMRCLGTALLILLTGCGWLGQDIAARSVDYYNYMVGQSPRTPILSRLIDYETAGYYSR